MREGILYPQGTLFRRYVQYTGVGSHSTSSHTGQSQGLNSGRVELEAYAFLLYGHSNILHSVWASTEKNIMTWKYVHIKK